MQSCDQQVSGFSVAPADSPSVSASCDFVQESFGCPGYAATPSVECLDGDEGKESGVSDAPGPPPSGRSAAAGSGEGFPFLVASAASQLQEKSQDILPAASAIARHNSGSQDT